jgi:hypothetical protein
VASSLIHLFPENLEGPWAPLFPKPHLKALFSHLTFPPAHLFTSSLLQSLLPTAPPQKYFEDQFHLRHRHSNFLEPIVKMSAMASGGWKGEKYLKYGMKAEQSSARPGIAVTQKHPPGKHHKLYGQRRLRSCQGRVLF